MSLLDNASLLLTPNAYKEGKLYSVIPSNGNGDFTATRATTATRVNSAGLVDFVPYNLLQYSEMFSNAAWTKNASSVTANTTTAPDNTLTADTLIGDGTFALHAVSQAGNSINGVTYTHSIYAKKNTNNFIQLFGTGIIYTNTTTFANFDLNLGVVGAVGAGTTASIQDVGNGWYRCTMTATATSSQTAASFFYPCLVTSATSARAESNNLTTSVFLWGAQLVEGTSARDYLRTETRLNIPRVDYSLGGCPNILLEPQRTNLALQSSSFDNATWVKQNTSVTANETTSPSGIQDADKIVEDVLLISHNIFSNITTVSGSVYNVSFYAKAAERGYIQYNNAQNTSFANFDLINGVVGTSSGVTNEQIQSVGNGWYRCSLNITATSTGTAAWYRISIVPSASATRLQSYLGDGTSGLFIWGAQWELGAYATSYIPTTTASVTRNDDLLLKTGISSLINGTQGTLYLEVSALAKDASTKYFSINDGTTSNEIVFQYTSTTNQVGIRYLVGGIPQCDASTIISDVTAMNKFAYTWQSNKFELWYNGTKVISDTSGSVTTGFNQIRFGRANGTLSFYSKTKALGIWQTALTDAECIQLTTI